MAAHTEAAEMADGQWAPAPTRLHELRYFDGTRWTEHVSDRGLVSRDPLPQAPTLTPTHTAAPTGAGSPNPSAAPIARPVPSAGTAQQVPKMPDRQGGLLSGRKSLQEENDQLRSILDNIGVPERDALREETEALRSEASRLHAEIAALRTQVVATNEQMILQEVGVYEYSHPLDSSVAYKTWLDETKAHIKRLVGADRAVTCTSQWTVNGSTKEGAKMVRDISKLMLRAYNAEADTCVRSLKPTNRDSTIARLDKTRETIAKLGQSMQIRISDELHATRVQEIRVTADFLAKREEEREREREDRARLREEERVAREIAAEQAKLAKERQQYFTALQQLRANGDEAATAAMEAKLAEIDAGLAGLAERAANTRAGHVYVISNVGAFGERMVKIGMTRRLEPMDRIRELGDASVPFRYDVHAMFFSPDAVGIETALHRRFADLRVNLVNAHREFFYVTPTEVRTALAELDGHPLEFTDEPLAEEFRQSQNERSRVTG